MNMDRLKYRYWQHTDWHDKNSPLEAVYCNAVDGCDPTIAVSDFEFCTGLKDKNGNLIYEGDIIHDLGEIEPICSLPLIVRWGDRTAGFYLDHQKIGMRASLGWIDSADSHNYEIIGNVHEQADQKDKKERK